MSRLKQKIQTLEAQISNLQAELEAAESKLERSHYHRNRKSHQKWVRKNPAMARLCSTMMRAMYEPTPEPGETLQGLLSMLEENTQVSI